MRNAWRTKVVVLLASAVIAAGCTSTQPDRVTGRTASLTITGTGQVDLYNCYDLWQDTAAPIGIIDASDTFIQAVCEPALDQRQTNLPWPYSIGITVIPAGTTQEIVAVSTTGVVGSSVQPQDGVDDFVSLTPYDLTGTPIPPRTDGTLFYINGKTVGVGSPVYLATIGVDPGEAFMLQSPNQTFDFAINSGDTVVVRARKQLRSVGPQYLPVAPDPDLRIAGVLSIDGVGVAAMGTTGSSKNDGDGFSFSFTAR